MLDIGIGCHDDVAHLPPVHGLLRLLVVGVGAGLHFDHHQLAFVHGHDVQLQSVLAPVAVEYRVALALQIGCYSVFAFLTQSVVCCHIAFFFSSWETNLRFFCFEITAGTLILQEI